jgi:hypothetical protein
MPQTAAREFGPPNANSRQLLPPDMLKGSSACFIKSRPCVNSAEKATVLAGKRFAMGFSSEGLP